MINTILVEDDLYIQKHFAERLKSNDVFRLVGVYRDAFEAEKSATDRYSLFLWIYKLSTSTPASPPQNESRRCFLI